MSRMLQALKQIESKRSAPAVPPAPIISRPLPPRVFPPVDNSRLRFGGSSPLIFTPSAASFAPTINAPVKPHVVPAAVEPRVLARDATPAAIAPVAIEPVLSTPAKIVTLPPPALILPHHDFDSKSQLIGQFDDRWSVTHSAIAPFVKNELLGDSSTVHTLARHFLEPTRHEAILEVVPPSGDIAAKYSGLIDQLLGDLRQGANHVLALPSLSYRAHTAGVATNLGITLTKKKLGPVLLVETPGAITSPAAPHIGRFGQQGLLEALQGLPWKALIHPTSLEGLSILRSGVQSLDMQPASIAASIESLWTELRADFRFVLVSAPPTLSSVSEILICSADRIYAVLELGESTLPQIQTILRRWEELGGHAVGCIALQS